MAVCVCECVCAYKLCVIIVATAPSSSLLLFLRFVLDGGESVAAKFYCGNSHKWQVAMEIYARSALCTTPNFLFGWTFNALIDTNCSSVNEIENAQRTSNETLFRVFGNQRNERCEWSDKWQNHKEKTKLPHIYALFFNQDQMETCFCLWFKREREGDKKNLKKVNTTSERRTTYKSSVASIRVCVVVLISRAFVTDFIFVFSPVA